MRLKNRLYQLIHDSNKDDPLSNPLMTVEEISVKLKDQFPEYKRMPTQGLLRKVKITLAKQYQVEFVNGSYFERSDVVKDRSAQFDDNDSEEDIPRPSANLINRRMLPYGTQAYRDETKPESSSKEEEEIEPEVRKKKVKRSQAPSIPVKQSSAKFQQGISTVKYSDLGGIDSLISDIKELVEFPLKHGSVFHHLGVHPSKGVLLQGPTGTGKTTFAMAICGEVGVPFFKVSAPEIISGLSGESEQNLRNLFSSAQEAAPSIIFIDQIDSIAGKREAALKELEKRVVAQFITCVDELNSETALKNGKIVIVLAATSQPEVIDSSLRATGRFDRELSLPIPSESQRLEILKVVTRKMKTEQAIDFLQIARLSPGYVAADLVALAKEAAMSAIRRKFSHFFRTQEEQPQYQQNLNDLLVTQEDFKIALKKVQPSAKREGFTTVPATTWEDVGALEDVKLQLQQRIVDPIKHPEIFAKAKVQTPSGVLLYGPPGCGKTLLAKAVSNESRANFISVKGPQLLNKYVGESQKAVRGVFARARNSAPCVVFFDELDALCPRRDGENSSSQVTERVVNQLLVEIAGLQDRKQVFIIGATNRMDIIDEAMLRPGRLQKQLYVGLPSKQGRFCILKTLTRDKPISKKVNIKEVAERQECEGFSGADLAGLVKEASMLALQQTLQRIRAAEEMKHEQEIVIEQRHFEVALKKIKPSVKGNVKKKRKILEE